MAVGVSGQYLFQFSLGSKSDFISERDFISFTMVEEAGNVLPTFALAFNTDDEGVLPLLNEGNKLQVSYGRDSNNLTDSSLAITGIESDRVGNNKRFISLTGVFNAIPYMAENKLSISSKKSGIAVIKDTVSKYFKYDGNVDASQDSQRWIQHNISDRAYVNQCWIHSDIADSFIGVGISSDGKFVLRDIKKTITQPYKWRFGQAQEDQARDIPIDGDPHISSKSGFMNFWMGYGREKIVYDLETAVDTPTMEKQEPLLALTSKIAKNAQVEKRFASIGIQNDNVHDNYWRAALRNLTNLAALLNVTVTASFSNIFKPVRVLDLAMYKESDTRSKDASSTYLSGLYFVSKVSRVLQSGQLVTTIQLNRESFNQVKTEA